MSMARTSARTLSAPTVTLAQQVMPRGGVFANRWVYRIALVVGGSLFAALCAQIRVPLPFTPVPITGLTLGVLLVGSLLGSRLGWASMFLYLLMGVVGLPFFAGGEAGWQHVQGATGGYLLAAPLAALLVGWLAERGWDRRVATTALSMLLGNTLIYLVGVAWLAVLIGLQAAIVKGLLPFLVGDLIKIGIACLVLPGGWRLLAFLDNKSRARQEGKSR
jgi:biotin transport system substrate-specific component